MAFASKKYLFNEDGTMPESDHLAELDVSKSNEEQLKALAETVESCRLCTLGESRTHTVFAKGNPCARVAIIGEAPGRNEDLQGEPFVGAAGKKLDALLELAHLSLEDVFIANILKCRPPSNRNPKAQEIVACAPYLRAQLSIVQPKLIITLGNFATQFILRTGEGISSLRGSFHVAGPFLVWPTFHPAATMYRPQWTEALESDFLALAPWVDENVRATHD